MKLLKIDQNAGHYRDAEGHYQPVDKLTKEGLLELIERVLHEADVELDEYDEDLVKNQAHQIIYKSVFRKLQALKERREEFVDESARAFLEEYERYRPAQNGESAN